MAVNEALLKVIAETNSALQSVSAFVQKANQGFESIERTVKETNAEIARSKDAYQSATQGLESVQSAMSLLKGVAGAAIAAFSIDKIVGFFEETISEATKSQDATNSLSVAFRQAGVSSLEAVDKFKEFADGIQRTTKFEDDAVVAAGAHIEALTGLSEEGLERATKAATELASTLGVDLSQASELIVKAHHGHTEALKRLGFQFQKGRDEAGTYENILAAIETRSGTATSQTNTFSGAVAQARNNFDDILKSIGGVIINNESLIKTIHAASDAFADESNSITDNKSVLNELVTGGVGLAVDSFGVLLLVLKQVRTAFEVILGTTTATVLGLSDLTKGVLDFLNTGLKDGAIDIGAAFGALKADVKDAGDRFSATFKVIGDGRDSMDKAIEGIAALSNKLEASSKSTRKLAGDNGSLAKSFKEIKESLPQELSSLDKALEKVGKSQIQIIEQEKDARLKLIQEALDADERTSGEAAKERALVEQDATDKIEKYLKEQIKNSGKSQLDIIEEERQARLDAIDEAAQYDEEVAQNSSLLKEQVEAQAIDDTSKELEKQDKEDKERAKEVADEYAKQMKDAIDKVKAVLGDLTKVVSITVDVSKAKKDLEEFQISIPDQLQALSDTGAEAIQNMQDAIEGQLSDVRDLAQQEGDVKIQNIKDEATAKEKDIKDKSALQLKYDEQLLDAQYKAGLLSSEDLTKQKKELELKSQNDLAQNLEQLQIDSQNQIDDQRKKNAQEIEDEVAKKRQELEDAIEKKRLDVEDAVAKKRLELEDQLAKKQKDLNDKTLDAGQKLTGDVVGAITDVFLPGVGDAVSTLVQGLAEGGSFLADSFTSIVGTLSTVFENLSTGLTGLIQSVIDNLDVLISSLVTGAVDLVTALVESAPDFVASIIDEVPQIISSLVEGLGPAIEDLARKLPDAVEQILHDLPGELQNLIKEVIKEAPKIGEAIGKAMAELEINAVLDGFELILNAFIAPINAIAKLFGGTGIPEVNLPSVKLATGGTVPDGFSNDSFAASLSSGELVVPKDDVHRLSSFLDRSESGQAGGISDAQLERILARFDRNSAKQVAVNVQVSQKDLAKAVLDLNRQGFRVG